MRPITAFKKITAAINSLSQSKDAQSPIDGEPSIPADSIPALPEALAEISSETDRTPLKQTPTTKYDDDIASCIILFNKLISDHNYGQACRLMSSYSEKYPNNVLVKEHLARSYHYNSLPKQEAIAWWDAFTATQRDEFAVCAIEAWTRAHDYKGADAYIRLLQAHDRTNTSVLAALAEYYDARGNLEQSATYWRLVMLDTQPENQHFVKCANTLIKLSKNDKTHVEIKSLLERGLDLYPDDVDLLNSYVSVAHHLGAKGAVDALDKLMIIADTAPYKWSVTDLEFIELSRRKAWIFYDDADVEALDSLLERLPGTFRGHTIDDRAFHLELLSSLSMKIHDWARATKYAGQFSKLFPFYSFGHVTLAYCLFATEHSLEAGRQIERVRASEYVPEDQKSRVAEFAQSVSTLLSPRQPTSPRIVIDVTGLARSLRTGGDIGGVERTVGELALAFCEGLQRQDVVLVNWKIVGVEVTPTDLRRALFQPDADHINPLLQCEITGADRKFMPTSMDVVLILGSAWQYDPANAVTRKYRVAGATIVLFVHDLLQIYYPNIHTERGSAGFRRWIEGALPLADVIVANSDHSRREIENFCVDHGLPHIATKKIELGDDFRNTASRKHSTGDQPVLNPVFPQSSDVGYVLYVSSIFKRKNHAFLIRAWDNFRAACSSEIPVLVIVGARGDAMDDLNEALIETSCAGGRITILHNVTDSQLTDLYRNCMFTVFPSICEGWGLPVAESLSYGKVCICTNATALPEVGGLLADYFDVGDETKFLSLLRLYAFDESKRLEREKEIRQNYEGRRWRNTAHQMIEHIRHQTGIRDLPSLTSSTDPMDDCTGVIIVCASWGRQCGIARYSDHVRRALSKAGFKVQVVRSIRDCQKIIETGLFKYIIVQHEYGLYDKINMDLIGPDRTDQLLSGMLKISNSFPDLRQAIIMHTLDMRRSDFRSQTSSILAASIPLVSLSSEASERTRSIFMEHGTSAPASITASRRHVRTERGQRIKVSYFGFLSPMKRVDKFLEACVDADASVIANFASSSKELISQAESSVRALGVDGQVTFEFLSDEDLNTLLCKGDVVYLPQGPITYWATTGSARVSLSADRPVITSAEDQFADMAEGSIFATETSFPDVLSRLKNPDYYRNVCERGRRFRSTYSFDIVYKALFKELDRGEKRIAPMSNPLSASNFMGLHPMEAAMLCYRSFWLRNPTPNELDAFVTQSGSIEETIRSVVRIAKDAMSHGFQVDIDLHDAFERGWMKPELNEISSIDSDFIVSAVYLMHLSGRDLFDEAYASLGKTHMTTPPSTYPDSLNEKLKFLRSVQFDMNKNRPFIGIWGERSTHLYFGSSVPSKIQRSRNCYRLSYFASAPENLRAFVVCRAILKREPYLNDMRTIAQMDIVGYLQHVLDIAHQTGVIRIREDIGDIQTWQTRHAEILAFGSEISKTSADELTGDNLALIATRRLSRDFPGLIFG